VYRVIAILVLAMFSMAGLAADKAAHRSRVAKTAGLT